MKNIGIGLFFFLFFNTGCRKFVSIDPPRTSLTTKTVFNNAESAEAATLNLYYQVSNSYFANGGISSISFLGSILSDEQENFYSSGTPIVNTEYQQFSENTLLANNSIVLNVWTGLYKCIYQANAVIEGLVGSTNISTDKKEKLTGEAKFIRAFCNFYLVNLWGDVPLVTTTDYVFNSKMARASTESVYQLIIEDLQDAKRVLQDNYSLTSGERVRANKGAAAALLARAFLYSNDWVNAETQSTFLIDNKQLYNLAEDLSGVTIKNNSEAILQFWSESTPGELSTFFVRGDQPENGALRESFIQSFEENDWRTFKWVDSTESSPMYLFSAKYHSEVVGEEYSTVFRLAEQYLIRAEARARLNRIKGENGAENDINTIRNRAHLDSVDIMQQEDAMVIIMNERKVELFAEWGHRWFDLKRYGKINEIMTLVKQGWGPEDSLLPIPEAERLSNPALTQNPKY